MNKVSDLLKQIDFFGGLLERLRFCPGPFQLGLEKRPLLCGVLQGSDLLDLFWVYSTFTAT